MDCKECLLARSCAQDKMFCTMDLIDNYELEYKKDNAIENYLKQHGLKFDPARGQDRTVVIVLVDGVPVQTPKWMEDLMEKLKKRDGMNVSQTFVDEWIGEKESDGE